MNWYPSKVMAHSSYQLSTGLVIPYAQARSAVHGSPRCGYGPPLQSYAGDPYTVLREYPSLKAANTVERYQCFELNQVT
jgi:hypothetical protein